MNASYDRPRLTAVLGPTNTGKTHLAMDRMLGHASGMIGFPLRLLARENYDRAVRAKGADRVALITGEEKIVPPNARWFLCTVEAMPLDRKVAFLGLDEVQMCADPERGHVFTDRLLHARGLAETMFMGAETAAGRLRALLPGIAIESRPRFSTLRHAGHRKITRLPARSAVVAFSAGDVYAIAELIRRQRGGAAVVLGALSPRTRNAQVELYQAGEVDYLVATDAIGMGLNMDVDHVAFAGTRKFDGRVRRALTPAEMGQIAGRAGRHMNDGTFGTTGDIPPLPDEIAARIEDHAFEPLPHLYWRNSDLQFDSPEGLAASLAAPPPSPGLIRAREADDEKVLAALGADADIRRLVSGTQSVELLWEVCRIPDFRQVMSDDHARLLGRIYRHLREDGVLPEDWIADHVRRLDRIDGDIDTLSTRIAHIRTWTYVAYHGAWLADAAGWQEHTRAVEDRLSDALHETLTRRFVDRRTSVLLKTMGDKETLDAQVGTDGAVDVAGHHVGHLEGFRFQAERTGTDLADKAVANAALKALPAEVARRVELVEADGDETIQLSPDGVVSWRGEAVARLEKSADALRPSVAVLPSGLLDAPQRDRLQARLSRWLDSRLQDALGLLLAARTAELTGAPRGLAFQLAEGFGSIRRHAALEQIEALSREDRQAMRALGIRIGREHLYMPALLKPKAQRMALLLWAIQRELSPIPAPPPEGRVSLALDPATPKGFYAACGYRVLGPLAIRLDMVERLAEMAWNASKRGPFAPDETFLSLAGCTHEQLPGVLAGLGYTPRKPRPMKAHPAPDQTVPEGVSDTMPEAVPEAAPEALPDQPAAGPVNAAPEQPADAKPVPVHYGRVMHRVAGSPRKDAPGKSGGNGKKRHRGGEKADSGHAGAPAKADGESPAKSGGRKKRHEKRPEKRHEKRHEKKGPPHAAPPKKREPQYDPDSPFAKLLELKLG